MRNCNAIFNTNNTYSYKAHLNKRDSQTDTGIVIINAF